MCVFVSVHEGVCGYAKLFPFVLFYFHSASVSLFHVRVKVIFDLVENTFWLREILKE